MVPQHMFVGCLSTLLSLNAADGVLQRFSSAGDEPLSV